MLNKIILLVEDNPDDQLLTMRALKKNNIANRVVIANDGKEAIDYIFSRNAEGKDNASQIAVVLLDLKLPLIDGFEVLKRIREDDRTRLTPVVILTSSKEEMDVLNGYKLGANSYIRKPVEFEEFTEAVKHMGIYWLLLNELPENLR